MIFGTNIESGSSANVIVHVPTAEPATSAVPRALTEADAVEIWIARWLRIRRKDLMAKYGCDPKRLYEIWWSERFPAAREKAEQEFRRRHPGLVERTGFGYRRIPRVMKGPQGKQLDLFG